MSKSGQKNLFICLLIWLVQISKSVTSKVPSLVVSFKVVKPYHSVEKVRKRLLEGQETFVSIIPFLSSCPNITSTIWILLCRRNILYKSKAFKFLWHQFYGFFKIVRWNWGWLCQIRSVMRWSCSALGFASNLKNCNESIVFAWLSFRLKGH